MSKRRDGPKMTSQTASSRTAYVGMTGEESDPQEGYRESAAALESYKTIALAEFNFPGSKHLRISFHPDVVGRATAVCEIDGRLLYELGGRKRAYFRVRWIENELEADNGDRSFELLEAVAEHEGWKPLSY